MNFRLRGTRTCFSVFFMPLIVSAVIGCGSGPNTNPYADIPGSDKAIPIEYRVLLNVDYPNADYNIVPRSVGIPATLKNYFSAYGTHGWETTGHWQYNPRFETGLTDTELRTAAELNTIRSKPSSWYLVCAVDKFRDDDGNILWDYLGRTYSLNGQPGTGQLHSYTFVAELRIQSRTSPDGDLGAFGGRVFDWVVAHELGHSVAGLRHPDDFPSDHAEADLRSYNGCAMWADPPNEPATPDNPMGSPNLRYILEKQSFCESSNDNSTCSHYLRQMID